MKTKNLYLKIQKKFACLLKGDSKVVSVILILTLNMSISCISLGQPVFPNSRMEIILPDSSSITLYEARSSEKSPIRSYYYLPTKLQLAYQDSIPEFSFLAFDKDEDGHVDGAILHFLLQWGLKSAQEIAIEQALKNKIDSTAMLIGSLNLESKSDCPLLNTDLKIAVLLKTNLQAKGHSPTLAGSKIAYAFSFQGKEAHLINELIRNQNPVLEEINFQLCYTVNSISNERLSLQISMAEILKQTKP